MKQLSTRLCLVTLAALALSCGGAARAAVSQPPVLAVALHRHLSHVEIGATKGFKLTDGSGRELDLQWGGSRITITGTLGGLRYRNALTHTMRVLPSGGGFAQVNGKPYRGTLELRADGRGGLDVVNQVGIEQYLWGVVKAEMSATAPAAAQRAQAVAARTFAMRNKDSLKAGEQSQVYGGVAMEDPRCVRAVNDTRGVVATFDGRLIEAQYHAACGGHTENNEDVWETSEPVPYERATRCWGCENFPMTSWSVELDYATIRKKLMDFQWEVGDISRIEFNKTATGRVKEVMVHSTTGMARIPGNNFRLIIDRRAIKSLMLESGGPVEVASAAEDEDNAPVATGDDRAIRGIISQYMMTDSSGHVLKLSGRGSGHGVGMCQWGARQLAIAGKTYQEILRYYYSGIELRRAY